MEASALQITWFFLYFLLIGIYAVLDGFDLGVGILTPFNKSDDERRLYVNAIAPVWDGNEVWLLTGGGALFAAFPMVYATVFSGFYLALMLVLLGLIVRAVAMEFRGKVESAKWRWFWDLALGVSSFLPALLFGVAVGNVLRGLPLQSVTDAAGTRVEFAGSFFGLLNPFSLLIGLVGLSMFLTQGALYMAAKSEGDLRKRLLATANKTWLVWVVLYLLATLYGFFEAHGRYEGMLGNPLFWLFFVLLLAGFAYIPVAIKADKPFRGLLASSVAILSLVGIGGTGLYPNLVPALNDPKLSLTLVNASSGPNTLQAMLVIALLGVPIVLVYTVFIYKVFKGKVVLDEHSY